MKDGTIEERVAKACERLDAWVKENPSLADQQLCILTATERYIDLLGALSSLGLTGRESRCLTPVQVLQRFERVSTAA